MLRDYFDFLKLVVVIAVYASVACTPLVFTGLYIFPIFGDIAGSMSIVAYFLILYPLALLGTSRTMSYLVKKGWL